MLFKPELAVALWTTGVVVVAVLVLGGSGGSPSEVVAMVGGVAKSRRRCFEVILVAILENSRRNYVGNED